MSSPSPERRLALALAAVAVLGLAACDRAGGVDLEESARAAAFYMESNSRRPGVQTLPSGVQYEVIRAGEADARQPDSNDEVRVHYEGTLTDGTVFDSSYTRGVPANFRLDALIPAWEEAIPRMKVGEEWRLYVPPEQAYGERGSPPDIPPNSVLIFRIELLGVASVPGGEAAPAEVVQG